MTLDPQNPYHSFVVRASAGSGKTYQLSQRFLSLVAAGNSPASILTLTFTRKAAGEMRERILESAVHLLKDSDAAVSFDQKMQEAYRTGPFGDYPPEPPRSAVATAQAILASTQSLRISTIDSLLLEWLRKFPFEASHDEGFRVPTPFDLIKPKEQQILHRRAWFAAVEALKSDPKLAPLWEKESQTIDLLELEKRIEELAKHQSYLWLLRQIKASTQASLLVAHPVPESFEDLGPKGFLLEIRQDLSRVCEILPGPKAAQAQAALAALDLDTLIELRVLTKSWEVHGGSFRKPKRDAVEAEIEAIHTAARLLRAYASRQLLNHQGQLLVGVYALYERELEQRKHTEGRLGFGDLIKGAFHLFQKPEAAGVRYLLHRSIRHLLLDEFQDTSILQWTMFRSMCEEMLSGHGLEDPKSLTPTIFVVGDAKQSIYGFREAEAEVLDEAANYLLNRQAHDVQLSASYRTAPSILRLVNEIFTQEWPHFPLHQTALKQGSLAAPGQASWELGPLFDESETVVQEEAQYLAERLKLWLEDPQTPAVYDKKAGIWRRPHPGDCALLYRNSTHAAIYAAALRTQNFAVRLEEGNSFFERLEIKDMRALCRWLAFPSHTESLVQILKSPLFRIKEVDLLEALLQTKDMRNLQSTRNRRLVSHLKAKYALSIHQLESLRAQREHNSPYALLEKGFREGAWLSAYARAFGEEGPLAVANLRRFLEWVAGIQAQGITDPHSLWVKLEEQREEETIALATVSDQAIQLMTIHKAKGLEYPLVILAGTGEEWERLDRYWAKLKNAPEGGGLAYIGRKLDRTEHDEHFQELEAQQFDISQQENLRLLYVALTRAQYHLIVTGHKRARSKPGFFERMKEAASRLGAEETIILEQKLLRFADPATETSKAELSVGKKESLAETPAYQRWIRSGLERTLGSIKILAPARLLQEAPNDTAAKGKIFPFARELGIFLHKGLECTAKAVPLPTLDDWLALCPPSIPRDKFQNLFPQVLAKLEKTLRSVAWKDLMTRAVRTWAELPLAYLDRGSLIRGTLDLLLEFQGQELLVLDYKTMGEREEPQDFLQLLREKRYDQQLALYQEGVRRLYPNHTVGTAIFFTEWDRLIVLQNSQSPC